MMKTIWKPLQRPELGCLNSISNVIWMEELKKVDRLTSVRNGQTLILASDYGGSHKGATHETISFVLADFHFLWLWDELRQKIRTPEQLGHRRISYKNLNDKKRRETLVPFLRYSSTIPGLLISFVVDKNILGILSESLPMDGFAAFGSVSQWKKYSFEKLTRVGLLGAMLISCMSAPGQNVIWLTDQDEIAPNDKLHREATQLIGHYMNHLLTHNMSHFRFGSTKMDPGSLWVEDLVSLPDLASGAICSLFQTFIKIYGEPPGLVHRRQPNEALDKDRVIAAWLADISSPLKRLTVAVDSAPGGYKTKVIEISIEGGIPHNFDWRPDVERYLSDRLLIYA
jgi:hypothetical protein